jgi:hypothetical protein
VLCKSVVEVSARRDSAIVPLAVSIAEVAGMIAGRAEAVRKIADTVAERTAGIEAGMIVRN